MRGKPRVLLLSPLKAGLIPAHAGKTLLGVVFTRARAHPRACGENHRRTARNGIAGGSSPRMRGKRRHSEQRRIPRRLIPAHAGKTLACDRGRSTRRAHPRACGENAVIVNRHLRVLWLIPAHAGKTTRAKLVAFHAAAHPRACGENITLRSISSVVFGSSPRMRGKQQLILSSARESRLIPAHAGKTRQCSLLYAFGGAHPRACGENVAGVMGIMLMWGSSPRMRGKRHGNPLLARAFGLIPAHAGKTVVIDHGDGHRTAHPRACGENLRVRS